MGITTASGIDFFHLGLLLVLIMVFITGIVIFVAVVGVCCFHWLDRREDENERGENKTPTPTPCQIRAQIHRLDQELSQQMERCKMYGKNFPEEGPPPYETLFPPPRTVSEHVAFVDLVSHRENQTRNSNAQHVYTYV